MRCISQEYIFFLHISIFVSPIRARAYVIGHWIKFLIINIRYSINLNWTNVIELENYIFSKSTFIVCIDITAWTLYFIVIIFFSSLTLLYVHFVYYTEIKIEHPDINHCRYISSPYYIFFLVLYTYFL